MQQEKSESQVLSEVFQDVRSLTKFYLGRTEGIDPFHEFRSGEIALNTLYWLTGHIVWSQHFLLVECLTGRKMDIPWLDKFDNGLTADELANRAELGMPTVEEIMETMDNVHEAAMQNIIALDDAGLDEDNHLGIQFRTGKAKRVIIRHAIRHEPCHTGQIGWILKMAGKETV
jgi:hypothetical protein